ncbi:MBL fold metallo-hydrolase [Paenibacillus methanolicus]|uniref:Glyoxylase-like metal-dependent hydrolase (Beta-lactamase superfamily II) n=1 Tax=Paenibacillus methanolicus TaxID=582686 RepID=A0A5S5CHJ2_9BACL|nr:MBL fold metallo-hydrolase [Paenibacillus methanolicus]TYP78078.1 glyoxylase-like metal-dependent hydrolase (beta-lactamase superfamily II) [Paenibacillus methanolicus]
MSEDQEMTYGEDYGYIPATSVRSGVGVEVSADLYCHAVQIVNIAFVGQPGRDGYVLVDAGMPRSADAIIEAAEERFGANTRPSAILLTHGHFDHVGAIIELIEHWRVPVYAHELELPYLTGRKSYPEPDPSVEGGMVAKLSGFFPNEPIDLGHHVQPLPEDGTVPFLPDFRWIATPGHTEGHVSFFREKDRALIAGDAFVAVRQEYLYKVVTQQFEISGPPRYFTPDWTQAKASVERLAALRPQLAITGHGRPAGGEELAAGLKRLADDFDKMAKPEYGKYIEV